MKIEYGSETLGDDAAGDFITPHVGRLHTRDVQQEPLLNSDYQATFPRRNARNTFTLAVDKEHADTATAVAYVQRYPASLAWQAVLRISESGETYETQACLVGTELQEIRGCSTRMHFTFISSAIEPGILGEGDEHVLGEGGEWVMGGL